MEATTYRRNQKRNWRASKRNTLESLRVAANGESATIATILQYKNALNKRKTYLKKERERVKLYRQKQKTNSLQHDSAFLKLESRNAAIKKRYTYHKGAGNVKKWKHNKRNDIRLFDIKTKLSFGNNINGLWMKYHKLLLTPLGFCIKTRNLFGVKYLLNEKASPTIQIFSNGSNPLDEAAWLGYSNITCCLIDYGALGNDGRSYGALHGAIHKKLHVAVRKLVLHGCDVNEKYFGGTPLRAALSCGISESGDVRFVKLLLRSKAHVDMKTVGGISTFYPNYTLTSHLELSMKYSNRRCIQAIHDAVQLLS